MRELLDFKWPKLKKEVKDFILRDFTLMIQ